MENEYEECNCHICWETRSCIFCSTRSERHDVGQKEAEKILLEEGLKFAYEKAEKETPKGIRFIDYYMLLYRTYYDSNYIHKVGERIDELDKMCWEKLVVNVPENQEKLCETCRRKLQRSKES